MAKLKTTDPLPTAGRLLDRLVADHASGNPVVGFWRSCKEDEDGASPYPLENDHDPRTGGKYLEHYYDVGEPIPWVVDPGGCAAFHQDNGCRTPFAGHHPYCLMPVPAYSTDAGLAFQVVEKAMDEARIAVMEVQATGRDWWVRLTFPVPVLKPVTVSGATMAEAICRALVCS